jgi:undecaprenyl-diphosphatase
VTDAELFLRINAFARATSWLHPLMTGWASYGIIAFAVLLLLGWWQARRRADPAAMAAALWAPLATLLAVVRLTTTRWRGLVTAKPHLVSVS